MRVIEHVLERSKLMICSLDSDKERQMQEKHGNKGKKLYCAFVDLEKGFDRVAREVTR